jgi:predicted ArsR family transcriptional regulator
MAAGERKSSDAEVIQFILDQVESVPHLEALLLLRSTRPRKWTVEELSKRLYITREAVRILLDDLIRRRLLLVDSADSTYYYAAPEEQDRLIGSVDETYRRQLVRVSQLIHSKPSAAVRDFARAFRFTKDE